jgi:succinate dehydrogenase / fumarate reductase cytochrome b subunit
MNSVKAYIRSSVGTKTLVALTGLVMAGFILGHMAGNLLMLVSPQAYNHYGHAITSNLLLLYPTEIILSLAFLTHVALTVKLYFKNRQARVGSYYQLPGEKGTTFAARTMILSGTVVGVFIILHLITFKFGPHYEVTYDGVVVRDLYRLISEKFHEPLYVAWYVFALIVLGLHISHGLKGAFQSLGLTSSFNPNLVKVAWAFTIVVAGGFILQPIYVMFFTGGP